MSRSEKIGNPALRWQARPGIGYFLATDWLPNSVLILVIKPDSKWNQVTVFTQPATLAKGATHGEPKPQELVFLKTCVSLDE